MIDNIGQMIELLTWIEIWQTSSNSNSKSAANELLGSKEYTVPSNQSTSIADEIRKLAKLKEEGLITEEEFQQMKQDLIRKNRL